MQKALRRIYSGFTTALVVLVVLLAILLVGVRLVGIVPYTVLSGSMEPAYHVGSLIYVQKVDPATLEVGDPLTYRMPDGTVVTHRIIEVLEDGGLERRFRTQGDANETVDGITPAASVIGKATFSVPYLGYISNYLKNPVGLICVVGTSAVVLIISTVIDGIFAKKKESEPESGEEENNG